MHWKKIVCNSNYIGEADFEPGEEKVATIKRISESETVTTAQGKEDKAVLHFAEKDLKPMILNVARSRAIEKVAKSSNIEDWPGVKIQLYIEHGIRAYGDVVNAVRVRDFKPRVQATAPVPPCADCGEPITDAMGKSAAWVAAYTAKNYGVPLCADCAAKRKAAQEETTGEEAPANEQPDEATETATETAADSNG